MQLEEIKIYKSPCLNKKNLPQNIARLELDRALERLIEAGRREDERDAGVAATDRDGRRTTERRMKRGRAESAVDSTVECRDVEYLE